MSGPLRDRIAAALREQAGRDTLKDLLAAGLAVRCPGTAAAMSFAATPGAAVTARASGGGNGAAGKAADAESSAGAVAPPAAVPESIESVLDTVKDAIIAVDSDGRITSVNIAATRVFDQSAEALVGEPVERLIPAIGTGDIDLETLATPVEDTIVDMTPSFIGGARGDGSAFTAEMTVSRVAWRGCSYVLCLRDVTERLHHVEALRDSEARYRTLVENSPEAILVFDVDAERFVDANDNAAKLFRMSRERLLEVGPAAISPELQTDGMPSFAQVRGYVDRALKGGRPVFEWLHRDAHGSEFPCEVRFVQLPSSNRRLIRASVIDISARRRADMLAYGERRVLELVAANAALERSLRAVVRIAEQLHPDVFCTVGVLDDDGGRVALIAADGLPAPLAASLAELRVGVGSVGCGQAASLCRQVVTRAVASNPAWSEHADALTAAGVQAVCSTPVLAAGGRIQGTLALYFTSDRGPTTEEIDLVTQLTQLAGIAIRRKQDETALRASEARFRDLFDNVVDGVFQTTPEGELVSANPALLRMLGCDSIEALRDLRASERFENPAKRERLTGELATHGRVRNFEYRLRKADGSSIVVVENSRVVHDATGKALYCEGTITDITQRKAAERALYEEKERAEVTLKSIGDAVLTTDARGVIAYLNPVGEELTGWERRAAAGRPLADVIELRDEATGVPIEAPVLRCLREGRIVNLAANAVLVDRKGNQVAIQDSAAPIRDRDGNIVGAVMVFHDVSQERQLHRRLAYHANHDSLTGLINRREFEERLSAALAAPTRGEGCTLLYLDLDQFKVVNDTCGHAAGDLLLRQLAEVLQAQMQPDDVFARLGGDEFAVLLTNCSTDAAVETAERLRESIANFRFSWRESSMQVGVSIGIVPAAAAADGVGSLLSAADVACYVAKDLGRNRIHVYEEGDASERHKEMQWVARVNRARDDDRLELFFQPIVPTRRGTADVPQFELLLRIRGEDGELVAPTAFIPAAERYNLMPSLDRWVIQEVFDSLAYRETMHCDPYMLAVNLSGTTLNDARFVEFVLDELEESDIAPGSICFEITETAAIANLSSVVSFMRRLAGHGCRFSLDDFGTGLSSLTYLKNLPVDYVKIDGQFIRNVTKDPADESVVDAIARMARAFKIQTIAERVESRQIMDRLGELGIDFAQGYFIAVPRPVAELPRGRPQARIPA